MTKTERNKVEMRQNEVKAVSQLKPALYRGNLQTDRVLEMMMHRECCRCVGNVESRRTPPDRPSSPSEYYEQSPTDPKIQRCGQSAVKLSNDQEQDRKILGCRGSSRRLR